MNSGSVAEVFFPDAPSVSLVRQFLRTALSALLQDQKGRVVADEVLMVVNELATNAALNARTVFSVRVQLDPDQVRVEVDDDNTDEPEPTDGISGLGLAMIDGSGLQWGVDRRADGKTSWVVAAR